jgi:ABC-type Fe3+-siderophore transport system permease subunit
MAAASRRAIIAAVTPVGALTALVGVPLFLR